MLLWMCFLAAARPALGERAAPLLMDAVAPPRQAIWLVRASAAASITRCAQRLASSLRNGSEFATRALARFLCLREDSSADDMTAEQNPSWSRVSISRRSRLPGAGRTARGTPLTRARETPPTAESPLRTSFAALRPPTAIASIRRADPPARNLSARGAIQKNNSLTAPRHPQRHSHGSQRN